MRLSKIRPAAAAAAFMLAFVLVAIPARSATPGYFTVTLKPGDNFENIFERTIYYRNNARRVSGFENYEVKAVNGNLYKTTGGYAYYGYVSGYSTDGGVYYEPDGLYYLYKGERVRATDASGPFFNVWLWGKPPANLSAGTTWTYRIPAAWEAGPSGVQTARVLSVDPVNGRIVLERSGSGMGAPLGKPPAKVDGVQPYYGKVTWKGMTIVRHGLIESDQLVMHADVIVPASATKPRHVEKMTEQIELGQAPYTGSTP